MRLRSLPLFVLSLALLALVAGCGASTAQAAYPPSASSVRIIRTTSALATPGFPGLDLTISDSQTTQAFYQMTLSLPHSTEKSPQSCPLDEGITYNLIFSYNGKQVIQATADPTGCEQVVLNGNDVRLSNDAYWHMLSQLIHGPVRWTPPGQGQ